MKIYKITEASEYLGVSINTLKTLANNGKIKSFKTSGEEAYQKRIDRAKELLNALLDVPLEQQDTYRINAVVKAIEHNRKLMEGEV